MSPWSNGYELFEGPGCCSLTFGTTTVSPREAVAPAPSHARQARAVHRPDIDLMALPPSSRPNEWTAFGGPPNRLFAGVVAITSPHKAAPGQGFIRPRPPGT